MQHRAVERLASLHLCCVGDSSDQRNNGCANDTLHRQPGPV